MLCLQAATDKSYYTYFIPLKEEDVKVVAAIAENKHPNKYLMDGDMQSCFWTSPSLKSVGERFKSSLKSLRSSPSQVSSLSEQVQAKSQVL